MTIEERISYINARGRLLDFFMVHMYSNNVEIFNERNDYFLNDMDRMKYFIERFYKYYDDETYDFLVSIPADADEYQEYLNDTYVNHYHIHSIKNAIEVIKDYLGLV